jgi:SAM-dependent methyltransferase
MNTLSDTICPVCGSPHLEPFFEMLAVPIYCNLLWSERQAAQDCPRGDIKLGFCPVCGFIGNMAFDPVRLQYSQDYENSLDFSPRFQEYAKSLATQLVAHHNLYNKDIIEIGCGKGDFLFSLCELGNNKGVGFDPSYVPLPEHSQLKEQLNFIQDFYSERYAEYQSDFICCRHTLEHISQPRDFLNSLRQTIGDRLNTAIFFEVPNALDTFRHLAIWDIIYEHCCYFAPACLSYAFASCGFHVSKLSEEFRGQFLGLEAVPGQAVTGFTAEQLEQVKQLKSDIATFTHNFQTKVATWKTQLEQVTSQGQRLVVWGAGSKGVTFLNLLKVNDQIEYIVDINPRKHGMYVAGTGQQIVPPQFLRDYQPDVAIVVNPIYEKEIQTTIASLGLTTKLMCV